MSETETPDKVVTLFGGATSHLSGEPNKEVIAELEKALEYAKAGQLLSVVVSGSLRSGSVLNLSGGIGQGTTWAQLSAMELALFELKYGLHQVHEVSDG